MNYEDKVLAMDTCKVICQLEVLRRDKDLYMKEVLKELLKKISYLQDINFVTNKELE
tara:strand:+ start:279 stop:449 length:171 start_codon:yes stop_codon:yes gene_type:complete